VSQPQRVFAISSVDNVVEAEFGEQVELLGYDLAHGQDMLRVTLHWQALARMEVSYKVFVHVVDKDTERLLAQADVVPHDWAYPTTRWEAGEVVSDEVPVDVSSLAAGTYDVCVGVYAPESGTRLTIAGPAGITDQLCLDEIALP
jgi:hypothetical protein